MEGGLLGVRDEGGSHPTHPFELAAGRFSPTRPKLGQGQKTRSSSRPGPE
jgi:hypothetical protein